MSLNALEVAANSVRSTLKGAGLTCIRGSPAAL
eukprot:CAMPEP_0115842676 /NCGR_PEP_ID=MMETSP0287-20121206/7922_1 /TAXON_ID=412157 /ORGANISM="Chrysochromulina rotalis, Strain UIO044" /LENGTH=32 /DNA_ID= /DNA_START= /DNA_END= /DNA_ORIENTATION=